MKKATVVMLLVSALMATSALPAQRLWGPAVKMIQQAAWMKDPQERETTLRQTIQDGLLSPDRATRQEVFEYLSSVSYRWFDLRPYSDLVKEFARLQSLEGIGWFLDEVEYRFLPREDRLALCKRAIVAGEAVGRWGRPWPRAVAMELAALDGLSELGAVIEQYHSTLPSASQQRVALAEILLLLDLRTGACDREDALRLSAQRLSEVKGGEFEQRIGQDAVFRQVVLETAREVCAVNPFTGERNPGCSSVWEIATRQEERKARREAEMRAAGEQPQPEPVGGPGNWLQQLTEISRPVAIVPPGQRHAPHTKVTHEGLVE